MTLNRVNNDRKMEKLWEELADVLFIEDKKNNNELILDVAWLHFEVGTDREEIWHWFDEEHSKGVAWLLYEYKKPLTII